jgi:heme/copper-type cytochrome/quinol oxidase subunit 3
MIFQTIYDFSHMIKIIIFYRIQTRSTILNYARQRNQKKNRALINSVADSRISYGTGAYLMKRALFFKLYFNRYLLLILVPHNICFKNSADMSLFCGETLNLKLSTSSSVCF